MRIAIGHRKGVRILKARHLGVTVGASGPVKAVAFDLLHALVDPEDFRPKEFRRATAIADLFRAPSREFKEAWAAGLHGRVTARGPSVAARVRLYCSSRGISPPEGVWPIVADILGRCTDLAIRNPRKSGLDALRDLEN